MNYKSVRCPSCSSPSVKQISDGKYICESCGTSFVADYDKEDVEYEKLKQQAEREKREFEQRQFVMNQARHVQQSTQKVGKAVAIGVIAFTSFVILFIIFGFVNLIFVCIRDFNDDKNWMQKFGKSAAQEQQEFVESAAQEQQKIVDKYLESWGLDSKEAEKAARLAAYKVTPEDLLADEFFVENATAALRLKLDSNTNLVWTNWVWNEEPEYLTSYLLTAKDDNARPHNMIINIYKVHWDKEYDKENGKVEKYIMYDATTMDDVCLNEDGTIFSSYGCGNILHNEIVVNQFLNGYADYDQLIREEIYGQAGYNYVEFQFPGASVGNESDESGENTGETTEFGDDNINNFDEFNVDSFGSDDENFGSDDENFGSDNENFGFDDENFGSDGNFDLPNIPE